MADNLDILFRPSTALSLTVTMSRKEEVLAAFEVLEDGGEVIYPPHSTTYSSCTTNVIEWKRRSPVLHWRLHRHAYLGW